jgi:hypothetical protein
MEEDALIILPSLCQQVKVEEDVLIILPFLTWAQL